MASTVAVYVCVVVMMSSSLPTALPLTPEKARYVFENTSDLEGLCNYLNIPEDNAASASEHFMQSTEPMKGRKMVCYLDDIGDTATVMECAEPPAGTCICSCGKEFCVVHLKLVMKQFEVICGFRNIAG